jgi:eukaryotic-like serine/threonine-protein kinase
MEPDVSTDLSSWTWCAGDPIDDDLLAWTRLGDGERCESWLAWSRQRWCAVTVKLLRPHLLRDGRSVQRLREEGDRLAALAHPGLQRLLAARVDDDVPHLVLEYVEGPSLDDLLEDDAFTPEETVAVGMHLAAALHYLHGAGLAHLDVKPGNVVLRDGRPVLIDLGLVSGLGSPTTAMRGTLDYLSPEQCRGEPVSAAMDLFAVGALLHELVTGEPAFEADDDEHPQQLETDALPVGELRPDAPAALAAVVAALLARDPHRRTPSCGHLLEALGPLLPEEARTWPPFVTPSSVAASAGPRSSYTSFAMIGACG